MLVSGFKNEMNPTENSWTIQILEGELHVTATSKLIHLTYYSSYVDWTAGLGQPTVNSVTLANTMAQVLFLANFLYNLQAL